MADQYQYAGLGQPGQTPGYPSFPPQYPNAGGDQGAQFLQGYALAQGNPVGNPAAAMFGGQSFDQNPYAPNATGMPVQQFGAQINAAGLGAGFPYGDYSQFNQYGPGNGMPAPVGDMQQFGQLLPNSFNQPTTGNIYEALAQEQGLAGFNAAAFLQDQTAGMGRGLGGFAGKGFVMNQRGGMNKFGNGNNSNNRPSNLPAVTNPDGLRDDTVFVSKLPQNIDHEMMKSQFGTIGKIKTNTKSGMPMIWIFKERGVPKGEALVTYEDSHCVQKAIKFFGENEFLGKKIEVKQATNSQRPLILPSTNNQPQQQCMNNMNSGNNQAAVLAAAAVAAAASGNTMSSLIQNSPAAAASMAPLAGAGAIPDGRMDMYGGGGGQFGPRGDGPMRGGMGRPPMGAGINGPPPMRGRAGDWPCPHCNNLNFAFRDQCKQCGAPRVDDGMAMMPVGGPPQRGNMPMPVNSGAGMMGMPPHRGAMQMMASPQGGRGMGGVHPMAGGVPPPPVVMGGVGRGMLRGGGRGGGPMRGSASSGGRMRPTPY